MFKSKKTYLIYSIIMILGVIFIIVDVAISWNSPMVTNRMRLFTNIILTALFSFKAIDYFVEWRNHGKPKAEQE